MKFGLFYELQLPKPYDNDTWNPKDEYRIIQEMLDQVELADKLGFDYVFQVEHHFLEEYSHSAAPEVVLAAASQRTKNIRLGHGIVQMPAGHNHPARTAERVATLDLVSNGRVEFGTGESASDMELGGFGTDRVSGGSGNDHINTSQAGKGAHVRHVHFFDPVSGRSLQSLRP